MRRSIGMQPDIAMAAGCIPLTFAGGGQKEIVIDKQTGFLWNTTEELMEKTTHIVRTEYSQNGMRLAARRRAAVFSKERFCKAFDTLLSDICKNKS
jgi:glycosyltransferase involved in cell wall biosynthesis